MSLSPEPDISLQVHPLQRWYDYTRAQLGNRVDLLAVSRLHEPEENWTFTFRQGNNWTYGGQRSWVHDLIQDGWLTLDELRADPDILVALDCPAQSLGNGLRFEHRTERHNGITRIIPDDGDAARRVLVSGSVPDHADYAVLLPTQDGLGVLLSPSFPRGPDGLPDPAEWGVGLNLWGPPQSLLVLPNKRGSDAFGWPGAEGKQPRKHPFVPLRDALERGHPSDAHTAAYYFPTWRTRINVEGLKLLPGEEDGLVPLLHASRPWMAWLFIDVDDVESKRRHKPACEEWRATERAKVQHLLSVYPGAYVYETDHGYRILYRLPAPQEAGVAWGGFYLHSLDHLRQQFGINADRECDGWNRLFRLPLNDRPRFGDARNIGYWTFVPDPSAPPPTRPKAVGRSRRGPTVGKVTNFLTALPAGVEQHVAAFAAALKETDLQSNWHWLHVTLATALVGREGMPYAAIPAFCRAVARAADDCHAEDRFNDAQSSLERASGGTVATGYPELEREYPAVAAVLDQVFPKGWDGLARLREQIENAPVLDKITPLEASRVIQGTLRHAPTGLTVLKSTTGAGKTYAATLVAVERAVREEKTVIVVPTHAMAKQVLDGIDSKGGRARYLFGTTRKDLETGEPLCKLHMITDPVAGGVNIRQTFCRLNEDDKCPHAADCLVARGVDGDEDSLIVVGVHAHLKVLAEEAGEGLLIIDESPSQLWDSFVFSQADIANTIRVLNHGRAFGSDYSSAFLPAVEALVHNQGTAFER
jgi:hypothetical protein